MPESKHADTLCLSEYFEIRNSNKTEEYVMFDRRFIHYLNIARARILQMHLAGEGVHIEYSPAQGEKYKIANELASIAINSGVPACTELYVMGKLLAEGPKLFKFNARDCEALENFDLSIPSTEYAQPYPTLLIELPKDYTQSRVVAFNDYGVPNQHSPQDIIVHHDPRIHRVLILMRMSSTQVLTRTIRMMGDRPVEDSWKESCHQLEGEQATLAVNKQEEDLSNALTRLALSSCLMLMVYGTKKVGPENPQRGRRKGNWSHTIRSNPRAVYLTDAYAHHFAIPSEQNISAIFEINTKTLDQELLIPDEDVLARVNWTDLPELNKLDLFQKIKYWSKRATSIKNVFDWKRSLERMGTCAYYSSIPISCITRYILVNFNNFHLSLFFGDSPPHPLAYQGKQKEYKAFIQWLFGDIDIVKPCIPFQWQLMTNKHRKHTAQMWKESRKNISVIKLSQCK